MNRVCDSCSVNEGKYKSLGGLLLCKKCADDMGLCYKEEKEHDIRYKERFEERTVQLNKLSDKLSFMKIKLESIRKKAEYILNFVDKDPYSDSSNMNPVAEGLEEIIDLSKER